MCSVVPASLDLLSRPALSSCTEEGGGAKGPRWPGRRTGIEKVWSSCPAEQRREGGVTLQAQKHDTIPGPASLLLMDLLIPFPLFLQALAQCMTR